MPDLVVDVGAVSGVGARISNVVAELGQLAAAAESAVTSSQGAVKHESLHSTLGAVLDEARAAHEALASGFNQLAQFAADSARQVMETDQQLGQALKR